MWSNFYHDLPVEESLSRIKKAGFNFTELSDSHFQAVIKNRQFDALVKTADKTGIKIGQLHAPIVSLYIPENKPVNERLVDFADFRDDVREKEVQCIEDWLYYCGITGIDCIVVHPGGMKGWNNQEEYKKIMSLNYEVFSRLCEKAGKEKVKIAIENMGNPLNKNIAFRNAEELVEFIDRVNSPHLGICLDTSHANNVKNLDIPGFIATAGKRLIATHISDNRGEHDEHLLPFAGTVKWYEVVNALKATGYSGLFNLEIPGENRCPLDVRDLKITYAVNLCRHLWF